MNTRGADAVVGSFALAFVFGGCHATNDAEALPSASSHSHSSPSAPNALAASTLVGFDKFTLRGSERNDTGSNTAVELTLWQQEGHWLGTLKEGDSAQLSVLDVRWERIETTPTNAAFRLTYSVELCEHASPSPRVEVIPWRANPPCYYEAGNEKPKVVRRAEVRLRVDTHVAIPLADGKVFTVAAVGTPDIRGLQTALVLSGLARRAEDTAGR